MRQIDILLFPFLPFWLSTFITTTFNSTNKYLEIAIWMINVFGIKRNIALAKSFSLIIMKKICYLSKDKICKLIHVQKMLSRSRSRTYIVANNVNDLLYILLSVKHYTILIHSDNVQKTLLFIGFQSRSFYCKIKETAVYT